MPSAAYCRRNSSTRLSGTRIVPPPGSRTYSTRAVFSFEVIELADSASRSENRTPQVGVFSQYADPMVSPTTATNAMARLTTCFAVSAAAAALSLEKNCSKFTWRHFNERDGPDPALDRHPHD